MREVPVDPAHMVIVSGTVELEIISRQEIDRINVVVTRMEYILKAYCQWL